MPPGGAATFKRQTNGLDEPTLGVHTRIKNGPEGGSIQTIPENVPPFPSSISIPSTAASNDRLTGATERRSASPAPGGMTLKDSAQRRLIIQTRISSRASRRLLKDSIVSEFPTAVYPAQESNQEAKAWTGLPTPTPGEGLLDREVDSHTPFQKSRSGGEWGAAPNVGSTRWSSGRPTQSWGGLGSTSADPAAETGDRRRNNKSRLGFFPDPTQDAHLPPSRLPTIPGGSGPQWWTRTFAHIGDPRTRTRRPAHKPSGVPSTPKHNPVQTSSSRTSPSHSAAVPPTNPADNLPGSNAPIVVPSPTGTPLPSIPAVISPETISRHRPSATPSKPATPNAGSELNLPALSIEDGIVNAGPSIDGEVEGEEVEITIVQTVVITGKVTMIESGRTVTLATTSSRVETLTTRTTRPAGPGPTEEVRNDATGHGITNSKHQTIIGGILGAAILLLAVAFLLWFLRRRRRGSSLVQQSKRRESRDSDSNFEVEGIEEKEGGMSCPKLAEQRLDDADRIRRWGSVGDAHKLGHAQMPHNAEHCEDDTQYTHPQTGPLDIRVDPFSDVYGIVVEGPGRPSKSPNNRVAVGDGDDDRPVLSATSPETTKPRPFSNIPSPIRRMLSAARKSEKTIHLNHHQQQIQQFKVPFADPVSETEVSIGSQGDCGSSWMISKELLEPFDDHSIPTKYLTVNLEPEDFGRHSCSSQGSGPHIYGMNNGSATESEAKSVAANLN